jgi:hypothetical protein
VAVPAYRVMVVMLVDFEFDEARQITANRNRIDSTEN